MASGDMPTNADNIPQSALYTAATWKWAKIPCAEMTTPKGAEIIFAIVNAYMRLYRLINPRKYSLHHSLLHRHVIINHLLENAHCPQVIEIAAGFSPRGAHISSDPGVQYFEVDLEDVVALKHNQLNSTEGGRAVLGRENFHQVACDIQDLDFTERFSTVRTFVITEGLMMYFSRDEQMAIWEKIADFIRANGGEYTFDYIPLDIEPARSPVGRFLHNIKARFGGDDLGFCYDDRGVPDIKEDLLKAGFSDVEILETSSLARTLNIPGSEVRTHVAIYRCR